MSAWYETPRFDDEGDVDGEDGVEDGDGDGEAAVDVCCAATGCTKPVRGADSAAKVKARAAALAEKGVRMTDGVSKHGTALDRKEAREWNQQEEQASRSKTNRRTDGAKQRRTNLG